MTTTITVIGNLVQDQVRLNHTTDGTAAVNFTVADNTRYYDEQANQWKQAGEATYWNVEVFGDLAERVAEHAHKGQRAPDGCHARPILGRSFAGRAGNVLIMLVPKELLGRPDYVPVTRTRLVGALTQ